MIVLPPCPEPNSTEQCSQLLGLLNCAIKPSLAVKKASNIEFPCDRDNISELRIIFYKI